MVVNFTTQDFETQTTVTELNMYCLRDTCRYDPDCFRCGFGTAPTAPARAVSDTKQHVNQTHARNNPLPRFSRVRIAKPVCKLSLMRH